MHKVWAKARSCLLDLVERTESEVRMRCVGGLSFLDTEYNFMHHKCENSNQLETHCVLCPVTHI